MYIQNEHGERVSIKGKELKNRYVRLIAPLQTRMVKVPVGWEGKVISTWRGRINLEGNACDRCGVSVFIRQVPLSTVVLVEEIPFG